MTDEKKNKDPVPGAELADLAQVIGAINRISDRLQQATAGVEPAVTVTDWLLLRVLNDEGAMPMASAARRIGVSRQRVHQQAQPLKTAGLIEMAEDDAKTRALSLTPKGADLMKRLEHEFTQVLSAGGAMPAVPINGAKLNTRRILKAMAPKKDAEAGQ